MALATTCPQCGTSFKVVPDQLKLRRGLVRCGACRHVFSGIDSLIHLDDLPPPTEPAAHAPAIEQFAAPTEGSAAEDSATGDSNAQTAAESQTPSGLHVDTGSHVLSGSHAGSEPPAGSEPHAASEADDASNAGDGQHAVEASAPHIGEMFARPEPVLRANPVPQPEDIEPIIVDAPADLAEPVAELPPLRAEESPTAAELPELRADESALATQGEADAVDFFGGRQHSRGFTSRGVAFAWIASVALVFLLALQSTIGARDWIAAWMPALRPALATAVAPLGLEVQAPRSLESLTIESFELQESGVAGLFGLSALLRNSAAHAVRWPSLELTLVDEGGTVIARKVLQPRDYLGGEAPALQSGVAAKAELPVRGAIQTRDLAPTGYSVKVFYP